MENETVNTRLSSAEAKHSSLLRTFQEQSRRLADAHANIANLTSNAAAQKMSYRVEFDRLMEDIRLLGKRGDEARQAVADREAELERHAEEMTERENMWEERLAREENARKVAEKRADDLKVTLQQLTAAEDGSLDISPAAALASNQRLAGKSYTQFYADYVKLEYELSEKDKEVQRLTTLVEEISQDINEQVRNFIGGILTMQRPIFNQMRSDHEEAVQRANELAGELSGAIAARDRLENRVKSLEAAATLRADEVSALESQLQDRDAQCKTLLRQIEIHDNPSLAYVAFDSNAKLTEGDPITDRLLLFKSLPALQEQNSKLLRVVRALQAQLSDRETARVTADNGDDGALDQAAEAVTKLHEKLVERQNVITDLQAKILEVSRERDVFSRLLSRGEGLRWPHGASNGSGPLDSGHESSAEAITSLQAELDVVRKKADDEVAEAKKLAREKNAEASTAELERSKAEARATMLQGIQDQGIKLTRQSSTVFSLRLTSIRSKNTPASRLSFDSCRSRLDRFSRSDERRSRTLPVIRRRRHGCATSLPNCARRRSSGRACSPVCRPTLRRCSRSVPTCSTLSTISRMSTWKADGHVQRSSQSWREGSKSCSAKRELLWHPPTDFSISLREQADQAREATKSAELKVSEADARIATETASIRSELDAAKALAESKTAEIATLKEQVESAKRIGLNWQRRSRELQTEVQNAAKTTQEAVAAKEADVATLKTQLEEAQTKLTEVEKKVSETERDVQTKASTIEKLQAEVSKAQTAAAAAPAAAPAATAAPSETPAIDPAQFVSGVIRPKLTSRLLSKLSATLFKPASPRLRRISRPPRLLLLQLLLRQALLLHQRRLLRRQQMPPPRLLLQQVMPTYKPSSTTSARSWRTRNSSTTGT